MIESHVPSLNLCRRLRELGFPQETTFVWYHGEYTKVVPEANLCFCERCIGRKDYTAAPLADELWEWLPREVHVEMMRMDHECELGLNAKEDIWQWFEDDSMLNALARALIWCAERGFVKWEKE